MFKCALLYGMTSEEFWFGNPQDYFVYQDAFAEKEKRRIKEQDIVAWQFARYNLLAFSQVYSNVFGKKGSSRKIFPQKPESIKNETSGNPLLSKFTRIAEAVNRKFKK